MNLWNFDFFCLIWTT